MYSLLGRKRRRDLPQLRGWSERIERERGREREGGRERGRKGGREGERKGGREGEGEREGGRFEGTLNLCVELTRQTEG